MKTPLFRWANDNRIIVKNASSLVSTAAVTSALGFIYWWLAARQFSPPAVGLASAAVSAMMLLGSISALGLGSLLINELPRHPDKTPALIVTAVLVAGTAGGVLGMLFALVAPRRGVQMARSPPSRMKATIFFTFSSPENSSSTSARRSFNVPSGPNSVR